MEEQWAAGLARRMISGDRDAFDELMKQFYPGLLRAAYLIAGNRADSEDIVQETFAACWAGRMRIRDPEHIGKWLYKTMTREAWRTGRRGRREQPVEEVFSEDTPSGYSVLDEVVSASGKQELLKAIAALPVKQRTVLVLYYYNVFKRLPLCEWRSRLQPGTGRVWKCSAGAAGSVPYLFKGRTERPVSGRI